MPRPPRLHVPGGCYHVILRGNHRKDLFASESDRDVLNRIVADSLVQCQARLHAFCWMTNHLHALIQIHEQPLGKLMQRIAGRYSKHRHRRLRTTGHSFERRYKAWLIDVDSYFVTLLRYIHLNPVKARIATDASDYRWSSHRVYLGTESLPWVTSELGLSFFGSSIDQARSSYRRFMMQPLYASEERVLAETHELDPRVIGTDRFMASLQTTPYRPKSPLTLEQLASEICRDHAIAVPELRSRLRHQLLRKARREFSRRAIHERIANVRQTAEFLNRDPSTASRML